MATTTYTPSMLKGAGTRGVPLIPKSGGGGDTGLATVSNAFSMEFNGVDDSVVTTSVDNLQNSTTVSVSTWVKTNTNGNKYDVIVLANNAGNSRYGIEVGASGKAAFVVRTTSAPRLESTTVLSDNTWKNIVGTWDGTNTKIYINGVLENTGSLTGTIPSVTSLEIGGLPSYYFQGNIDEVAIFTSSLDASTVESIYSASLPLGSGVTGDLSKLDTPPVAWYRMGD